MVLVSLYATYDVAVSLPKIAGLVYGIAVFYATAGATARSQRSLAWGVGLFLTVGVGLAGLALLGTRWPAKFPILTPLLERLPAAIRGLPGAAAGFHPNEVAGALLWFIPLTVALCAAALLGRSTAPRVRPFVGLGAGIALIVMAGELILTQSRGGLVGLAVGLIGMLAWLGWWGPGLSAALLGAAGLVFLHLGSARVGDILFGRGETIEAVGAIDLAGRVELWSRAIYGIQDFPFTGMGMNTFRTVVNVLYPLFLVGPDVDIGHAHNEFLQAALDLGIPGLIAFIAIYLGAFWMLFQVWRHARHRLLDYEVGGSNLPIVALVLGLGGGLLAHMLYGLTDAVALGAKPGVLFWMLLGLIVGLYQHLHDDAILVSAPTLQELASHPN